MAGSQISGSCANIEHRVNSTWGEEVETHQETTNNQNEGTGAGVFNDIDILVPLFALK